MTDTLSLRDYQTEAIQNVFQAWSSGIQRPAVVLPTGMGKTVIFSHLAIEFIRRYEERVVVLVHRDELADQAMDKMKSVAPHLRVGKVKAESDEIHADVVVCSVQTLAVKRRLDRLINTQNGFDSRSRIGLVIVDECHHAAAQTYKNVLETFGCFRDEHSAFAVGFTATLARGDKVGLGDIWQEVVCNKTLLYGISRGYLTDVRGMAIEMEGLDLSSVKKSRGDYQASQLGEVLHDYGMAEILPVAYKKYAEDRPGVVFTPTVGTAVEIVDSFNDAGIVSAVITGATPRSERQEIYDNYRKGSIQVLVNCMVLTEGFDAPWASCAVIARPTQSQPLYVQMVGRVLRPWPGKKDALVLDVVGSGGKLSTLIDLTPGEVESIRAGESLSEAVLRENEEANEGKKFKKNSPQARNFIGRDLDLFEGSSHSWLMTDAGVMFIPMAEGEVFLWPAKDGLWDVCYAPLKGAWQRIHTGLPLGMAQAWAETEAEEKMTFDLNTAKSAAWRKKKASEAQVNYARALGANVTDDARSGDVGNLISVKLASRKFDRFYVKA